MEREFCTRHGGDGSGLFFYTKQRAQERTAPSTVPAPVIAPAQKDELKRVVDQVKVQGQREGWSTLYTIGLIALLGVAIALLIFLTPEIAVVSALLTALRVLLLAVNAGRLTLAAGLAAMFAIPTAASAAEAEGAKKQAGLLDGTIDWFKSWF